MIRRKKHSIRYKYSNRNKSRGTTIGVMGVGNSVGTTTIAIALAHYLQSRGCRIAILEMSKREVFAQVEQYVEGYCSENETFLYKGVDYYKRVEDSNLSNVLSKNYDFFLLDLGNGRNAIKELIRSDHKLVVMLHSEWRNGEVMDFLQTYSREGWFKDIVFVNNLHTKNALEKKWIKDYNNDYNKDYNKEVQNNKRFNIPLIWDKYKVSPEVREIFREIVELN